MQVTLTGWALLLIAVFWAVLVGFLSFALVALFRVLQTTRDMIEDMRRETTPLLRELNETVDGVNREMVHVDEILVSVKGTAGAVEGISKTVQTVVTHPAIRFVSVAAGAATAFQRLRRRQSS